jgi:hypothetical protein
MLGGRFRLQRRCHVNFARRVSFQPCADTGVSPSEPHATHNNIRMKAEMELLLCIQELTPQRIMTNYLFDFCDVIPVRDLASATISAFICGVTT